MQLEANILFNKETNYSLILKMIDNYEENFKSFKELHDNNFRSINSSLGYIISPSDAPYVLLQEKLKYYREDKMKCYKGFLKYIEDFQYIVIDELNIIDEIKGSDLSPNVKTTLFNQLRKSSYSIDKIFKFINLPYESDKILEDKEDRMIDEKLKSFIEKIKEMILLNKSILNDHIRPVL